MCHMWRLVCVCRHVCVTCGGWGTSCESQLFPSHMCDPGIKIKWSGLVVSTFPSVPSCQPAAHCLMLREEACARRESRVTNKHKQVGLGAKKARTEKERGRQLVLESTCSGSMAPSGPCDLCERAAGSVNGQNSLFLPYQVL